MPSELDLSLATLSFPQKLFALMEKDHGDIVSWHNNGLCFRINDTEAFSRDLVPKYFKRKCINTQQ